MQGFDFTTRIDRSEQGSSKWALMFDEKPSAAPGTVPFSVADMEFVTPEPIAEALADLARTCCLGYTQATDRFYDAVLSWHERRHGWRPEREWLVEAPGVVPALYTAVTAYTQPGDGVIVQRPVYYPFSMAVESTGRRVVDNALVERDGSYTMDLDDLAEKAADPLTTMMILCSPHNPVGRVWTPEELRAVADICAANDVTVVCDEIHGDLVASGRPFTTFALAVDPDNAPRFTVCAAPSKTFNIAGVQCSTIFVPGERDRALFKRAQKAQGFGGLNCFAYRACEAAYNECEGWLDGLMDVVGENAAELRRFLAEKWPQVRYPESEGTYLAWIDLRPITTDAEAIEHAFVANDLFLDNGTMFGAAGAGFVRWNLACPTSLIEEALPRLDAALSELAALA